LSFQTSAGKFAGKTTPFRIALGGGRFKFEAALTLTKSKKNPS